MAGYRGLELVRGGNRRASVVRRHVHGRRLCGEPLDAVGFEGVADVGTGRTRRARRAAHTQPGWHPHGPPARDSHGRAARRIKANGYYTRSRTHARSSPTSPEQVTQSADLASVASRHERSSASTQGTPSRLIVRTMSEWNHCSTRST